MSLSAETPTLLNLFARINHLKSLPRTGWLIAGVANVESVADHTCGVALFALVLARAMNQAPAEHGLAVPLDLERVLSMALLHDLAESEVTDLPVKASKRLGREHKHQAELGTLTELAEGLTGGSYIVEIWQEYTASETDEARLVKDVDTLEMVHQSRRYARRGHRGLEEFWQGHRWHFPLCAELAAAFVDGDLYP